MNAEIKYDDMQKALPCDQLIRLFQEAGWIHGEESNPEHDASFNFTGDKGYLSIPGKYCS